MKMGGVTGGCFGGSGESLLFTGAMKSFPAATREKLGHYVYLYVDPRTDAVFYVGKGHNNRAFFHLDRDDGSAIATHIAEIRKARQEPRIEILVHGLQDAETALRVEAAAIDLLGREQLTNVVAGWGSREFGRYPIEEISALYCEKPARIEEDAVLLIRINQHYYAGMSPEELYEVTRGVWKLSIERAQRVRYVFAVFNNVVREVYEVEEWFAGGETAYFHREKEDVEAPDRIEFVGRVAPEAVRKRYFLKSVSDYFSPGNANPVQYVNC